MLLFLNLLYNSLKFSPLELLIIYSSMHVFHVKYDFTQYEIMARDCKLSNIKEAQFLAST